MSNKMKAKMKTKKSKMQLFKENMKVKEMNFNLRVDLDQQKKNTEALKLIVWNILNGQDVEEYDMDVKDMGKLDIKLEDGKCNIKVGKSWERE